MININCFVIFFAYFISSIYLIQCQSTNEYDRVLAHRPDYINIKHLPPILHNDDVYLSVIYKCSSSTKRRISLSIFIERTLYRTNFAVFRRYWFCQTSKHVKVHYIRLRLHRFVAYASDVESNFQSWPIEKGRLKLIMYKNEQNNENEILRQIQYDVQFLPVHRRPSFRSFRWNPLRKQFINAVCPKEPEIVRIIDYPLVLTGNTYGKCFTHSSYRDYSLRLEQQLQIIRPKFSIVLWLYIDEYCSPTSYNINCAILQHLTFNNTRLSPEISVSREGHITVTMFSSLNDVRGTAARTLASIPKKDLCRLAVVFHEFSWNIYINCLQAWNRPIKAMHLSPVYYYLADEFGTFVLGGSDIMPSFQGFISRMDIYRRVALTYEQLPNKLDSSLMPYFPSLIHESTQCKQHLNLFQQSREQYELFNRRMDEKYKCDAQPFPLHKHQRQCLLIPTWKKQLSSSNDIRYRIFRALRRRKIHSVNDAASRLYDSIMKYLESDDFYPSCNRMIIWLEQAICYRHPSAYSLLATFHEFGLCGLQRNSTRVVELLLSGALRSDRMSLLALGHRYFYGFDGFPVDYDSAYVYYQQMAEISRHEFYNPKPGEVSMENVFLTDKKLLKDLTFDKSDSFYWLKQQALRGVASAQHHLGALMYAGRHGLTRNIQAAVEYFRLGAAQHDASSHFGYGLALLKGQGTEKNVTEAVRQIEKAVEHGFIGAKVALGYHAYEIEKNYTKAAQYWKECFDQTYDIHCAHNLGVMWTAGRYPPNFTVDHVQAWRYYSFAAQRGQIDSKVVVAYYNARSGHPAIARNPRLAAVWSRFVAEDSSAVGTIARNALEAYQDRRWHTAFIFYLHTALAGLGLGYFNAGFLCNELPYLKNGASIDCIEELLNKYIMVNENNRYADSYALLTIAEYYHFTKANLSKAIEMYVGLYQTGDAQGLYNLAQMEEESDSNDTTSVNIWAKLGIRFDQNIIHDRYRRLQVVYQHCRNLRTPKSDESYIPCTLAYYKISIKLILYEQRTFVITAALIILSTILFIYRI